MKICFVANLNSIHAIRWIQPLIESKHEVYGVSYVPNKLPLLGAKEIFDLTKLTNVPKFRFLIWGLWLRRYIKRIQPDILHAHQIPAAGWMCAVTGFHPLVVTGWGSDLLTESKKSVLRKILTKIVLSRTDYFTVPSKIMYAAALELGFPEEYLYLIPWGVETNIFKPNQLMRKETRRKLNINENSPVIFCPRGIDPIYNHDIVIKACRSIISNIPDLRLIMLKYNTKIEYLKMLEQLIASENMHTNVIWLPTQNTMEDMAHLYQASDIVISIPSSEGYGFTVYESLASGIPVVITDLPVFIGELQDQTHVLKVPVRDVDKTIKALEMLITNPDLRHSLKEKGILISNNLSNQYRIAHVESLYSHIMDPI